MYKLDILIVTRDLKLKYFNRLEIEQYSNLIIWGGGNKGKYIARRFQQLDLPFRIITNNPKKIGHNIYGSIVTDSTEFKPSVHDIVIIAVANPEEQERINDKLNIDARHVGFKRFFFC